MKMPLFRSTAAAMIAVAGLALCHSAHASTRSTAGTPWEALQEQLDAGGTVTLTNDVTAADGDAMLTVTNAVTLDLNGHTIAFNGSKEVFHVGTGGDRALDPPQAKREPARGRETRDARRERVRH